MDRLRAMLWPIQGFKANKCREIVVANIVAYSAALVAVFGGYTWTFLHARFQYSVHFGNTAVPIAAPICGIYSCPQARMQQDSATGGQGPQISKFPKIIRGEIPKIKIPLCENRDLRFRGGGSCPPPWGPTVEGSLCVLLQQQFPDRCRPHHSSDRWRPHLSFNLLTPGHYLFSCIQISTLKERAATCTAICTLIGHSARLRPLSTPSTTTSAPFGGGRQQHNASPPASTTSTTPQPASRYVAIDPGAPSAPTLGATTAILPAAWHRREPPSIDTPSSAQCHTKILVARTSTSPSFSSALTSS